MSTGANRTHIYIGPDTKWGLNTGDAGRKTSKGSASGGCTFIREDGKSFIVGKHQVAVNPTPTVSPRVPPNAKIT